MAKRQNEAAVEKPNKSEAIRQALSESPEASPTEIAQMINQKYGYQLTAAYVSTIKSQAKKKAGGGAKKKVAVRRPAAAAASAAAAVTPEALDAAVILIEAAGGLEGAKATLGVLDRLKGRL